MNAADAMQALLYDPATGEFVRRIPSKRRPNNGGIGTVDGGGYLRIAINGRRYSAHRLAWLITHGEWPAEEIDHINGNRLDNRLSNLRPASTAENRRNRQRMPNSASGLKGASFVRATGKWRAIIVKDKKAHFLGTFDTPEQAHAAYSEAAKRLHLEFARPV